MESIRDRVQPLMFVTAAISSRWEPTAECRDVGSSTTPFDALPEDASRRVFIANRSCACQDGRGVCGRVRRATAVVRVERVDVGPDCLEMAAHGASASCRSRSDEDGELIVGRDLSGSMPAITPITSILTTTMLHRPADTAIPPRRRPRGSGRYASARVASTTSSVESSDVRSDAKSDGPNPGRQADDAKSEFTCQFLASHSS